jgi:large subunit ribosomal protein L16
VYCITYITFILFIIEAEGVPYEVAKEALRLAAQKLPVTTKFIVRRDYDAQNQNA